MLAIPAVEHVRDLTRCSRALRDVGVEEVERRPADVAAPDPGLDSFAGEVDLDPQRLAVAPALERQPERRSIQIWIELALVPAEDGLPKVPLTVEKPYADERNAKVTR